MTTLPVELTLLGWSVVLLFVYIAVQAQTVTHERGVQWNAGPRDGDAKPLGTLAGRAARALANFQETYPAFVALALALAVSGRTGGVGETGAWIWLVARIAYLPLYLVAIPFVRSLAFAASLVGLIMMLVRLL